MPVDGGSSSLVGRAPGLGDPGARLGVPRGETPKLWRELAFFVPSLGPGDGLDGGLRLILSNKQK